MICLLESLTLFLRMARSEAVKRTLLFRGATRSESPNRAHLRDRGSRVHWCALRLPPELDPVQADRQWSGAESGFLLWRGSYV